MQTTRPPTHQPAGPANPGPGTPDPNDIRAMETMRARLRTVVQSIEHLFMQFHGRASKGELMDWPTLQTHSQTQTQFLQSLNTSLSETRPQLLTLHPHPLPSLNMATPNPSNIPLSHAIMQLLKKKKEPPIDDWTAESLLKVLEMHGREEDVGEFVDVRSGRVGDGKGKGRKTQNALEAGRGGDVDMDMADDDENSSNPKSVTVLHPLESTLDVAAITELWNLCSEWRDDAAAAAAEEDESEEEEDEDEDDDEEEEEEKKDIEMGGIDAAQKGARTKLGMVAILKFVAVGGSG